jgi:hypothetical protein
LKVQSSNDVWARSCFLSFFMISLVIVISLIFCDEVYNVIALFCMNFG